MAYGDNRQDGDRWRGGRDENRGDNWRSDNRGGSGGGDRGFFERAGEQVRSWFGDDDDHRQRGGGSGGGWNREQGRGSDTRGDKDQSWGRGGDQSWGRDQGWGNSERWAGDDSFGGGWGNQAPPMHGRGQWRGGSEEQQGRNQSWSSGGREQPWGGGDRSDWGSGDRDRSKRSNWTGGNEDQSRARQQGGSGWGVWGGGSGGGQESSRHQHDPHYSEWRQRQIEQLDRDYDEYRREHQSKFDQEFHGWREKRQGQRQSMGRVSEQMEVIGSDGQHIGKVDKVEGERIILAKNDPNAGGMHHSVPCSWIESVDSQVHVNRTAEQAMREWRDEERSRALFEREDSGSEGPHMLNRSFSGTYKDRDDK